MQYLGGKSRISSKIVALIRGVYPNAKISEPFAGGCGATHALKSFEIGDAHPGLCTLYRAIMYGWAPSYRIDAVTYRTLKERRDWGDPHTALAAFGCSFGGKEFGGFARGNQGTDGYQGYAVRSLQKALAHRPSVIGPCSYEEFVGRSFADVFYFDPPYKNTTGYAGGFDHESFWRFVSVMRKPVFVSEYSCPVPHDGVLEIPHKQNSPTTERVFCFVKGRR